MGFRTQPWPIKARGRLPLVAQSSPRFLASASHCLDRDDSIASAPGHARRDEQRKTGSSSAWGVAGGVASTGVSGAIVGPWVVSGTSVSVSPTLTEWCTGPSSKMMSQETKTQPA